MNRPRRVKFPMLENQSQIKHNRIWKATNTDINGNIWVNVYNLLHVHGVYISLKRIQTT